MTGDENRLADLDSSAESHRSMADSDRQSAVAMAAYLQPWNTDMVLRAWATECERAYLLMAAAHDRLAHANDLAARRYRTASNDRATANVGAAFDGAQLADLVDGPPDEGHHPPHSGAHGGWDWSGIATGPAPRAPHGRRA